ncbi:uncharacterized protein B0P05DRAFT_481933 [Gilbertella persicaria]|uniref:uncharacterized protein n=1 Tax=Gilbertella persicaria TaxID=101096 RepID=UPI002220738E|nr:uncharacterized protein B0P05DRAFT_481933 [Gilbertella persicaria]KAI8047171.1 hypothetical protein B0P05DRAFT_481933 [Gilbertella persicaria]
MIVNHAQIIHFLNRTYLPSDPMNEEVYECKSLTNSDILSEVWKYNDLFDKKTVIFFGKRYDLAKKVLNYLPQYQLFVQNLKKERHNIVGYARKS